MENPTPEQVANFIRTILTATGLIQEISLEDVKALIYVKGKEDFPEGAAQLKQLLGEDSLAVWHLLYTPLEKGWDRYAVITKDDQIFAAEVPSDPEVVKEKARRLRILDA